mgnify:CR=1 FL=1
MQQRRKIRYLIAFVLLTAGILVLLLCNIGIGTVKIPRWLKQYTGKDFDIHTSSGNSFPEDLDTYDPVSYTHLRAHET